ncbi:hypothetical protein QSZ85_000654 [Escherichia coli]|uniref:hypothetical protein n=1 Tax=Escherichia coli TaxID=562 RepID=UPI001C708661|nr:hypothetical protein [Escherichia coli]EHJ7977364.1 hypothetical protein [Escherichia coli]ELD0463208.1 hypothetical protein [Escherichia coli]ELD0488974.1 hypothetical protein [Escherichia coli]ELD0531231.1 hypothetical protein [Escherichia coli]ELE8612770.1 hypothetical protein [Escherichia coli]
MDISNKISFWSMIGTWVSAFASIITAGITAYAARIAFKTLHSWKEKEKFLQLVRLKRAIFAYRQKVESISSFKHDNKRINDHVLNVLQPALSDIFHEMKLSGFKEKQCSEFDLFDALFEAQKNYEESQINYDDLLICAIDLQKAIEISF